MKNIIALPIKRAISLQISYAICLCALLTTLMSCDDGNLQVQQSYDFQLETMPMPKSIALGETIEIRCKLIVAGDYEDTTYTIRYFQPDGKGSLRLGRAGIAFLPNDRYPLPDRGFRLYYTSESTDQQVVDVYIENNFGQVEQYSFSFNNEDVE